MIIFLDVNGVLHPRIEFDAEDSWRVYSGPKYVYAPQLLEILRPDLDRIEIVLSEWGSEWPDPALIAALPAELTARIVGALWLAGYEADYHSDLATRYGCIQLWLKHRRPWHQGAWLSISSDASGWPEGARDRWIEGTGILATQERRLVLADRLRMLLA